MSSRSTDVVRNLEESLALDQNGIVSRPLDVIGLLAPTACVPSTVDRELLWRRLFLEAPLPFWLIARWAQTFTFEGIQSLLDHTISPGWPSTPTSSQTTFHDILREVAQRFDEFNPDLYPWDYGLDDSAPPQYQKYLLSRELGRSYVFDAASPGRDGLSERRRLLLEHRNAWDEWLKINAASNHASDSVCEATALALEQIVSRDVTPGISGVGRTHILLEQLNISNNPAVGVVTASLFPLEDRHHHLDGLIVPDLRENGLLVLSDEFLTGVAAAWHYSRSEAHLDGPTMLCFSVRPSVASVIQQLSGRSAEMAVLAAIESAIRKRALRDDVAASASLTLYGIDGPYPDPRTGPASFEEQKYVAAIRNKMSTVVVHKDVARQWNTRNRALRKEHIKGEPDVVPSEFFRRDGLQFLETRSQWKLAIITPVFISLAFAVLALLWQLYKMSAGSTNLDTVEIAIHRPLVPPMLIGTEFVCLFLSLLILQICGRSIRSSLDSAKSALLSLGICSIVVLLAQFLPVGVRNEGLLDNPIYSVLFGEPQVTSEAVSLAGGVGMLALHTITQTLGFLVILYGVSATVIRLVQARAHCEPHFGDRCELIKKDWRFSLIIMYTFVAFLLIICLPRNTLWYYYLTTLPGIPLIDHGGSFLSVVGPLIGITVVLLSTVGMVWLFILRSYLVRVVTASQGRSGYTSGDVVATLPRMAKLLYMTAAGE